MGLKRARDQIFAHFELRENLPGGKVSFQRSCRVPAYGKPGGMGWSLFNYKGAWGLGKGPGGLDFDVFWSSLGSILGAFGSHFDGLGGPTVAL